MSVTVLSDQTVYIKQKSDENLWQYSSDNVTYQDILNYPIHLTGNMVYFESNLIVSFANRHFLIYNNNITIDGKFYHILSTNESSFSYGGLIGNYDSTGNYSFTNVLVKNIKNYSNVTLDLGAGYILRNRFGHSGNCIAEYIYNYSNIPQSSGGIGGTYNLNAVNVSHPLIIRNCLNYGSIAQSAGGIVRYLSHGLIYNCHNFGDFAGTGSCGICIIVRPKGYVNSIYAPNNAIVSRCSNHAPISKQGACGISRIVTNNLHESMVFSDCVNTGNISGNQACGLFILTNNFNQRTSDPSNPFNAYNFISYCYNNGNIIGKDCCGILRVTKDQENRYFNFTINNCYNTGNLQGSSTFGIFRGSSVTEFDIINIRDCYSVSQSNNSNIHNADPIYVNIANVRSGSSWNITDAIATLGAVNGQSLNRVNYYLNDYNNSQETVSILRKTNTVS